MKFIFASTVVLAFLMGLNSVSAADPTLSSNSVRTIEIPLEAVFVPYQGYDSNDNIEVTVHSNLPNPCYRLDKYTVEKTSETNTFRIHQFAVKKMDGVCGEQSAMPEHLQMLVPFTQVISLGSKPTGRYTLTYENTDHHLNQKSLDIKEARATTIDDLPYAAVSNVSVTDVIQKNDAITATLSGVFTSTCSYLDPQDIKIEKQKDIYVVLPFIHTKMNVFCLQTLVPFAQVIHLDAPQVAGHILIHVRSMSGHSINRVIDAI
jgi:hypothetical protein